MNIQLKDIAGKTEEIAVITFKIKNDGNTKIKPISAPVEFYSLKLENTKVVSEKMFEIDNLLTKYYKDGEKWHLEPKDEINIDFPLVLLEDKESNEELVKASMVYVKILFVDRYLNAWKEQSILTISNKEITT